MLVMATSLFLLRQLSRSLAQLWLVMICKGLGECLTNSRGATTELIIAIRIIAEFIASLIAPNSRAIAATAMVKASRELRRMPALSECRSE